MNNEKRGRGRPPIDPDQTRIVVILPRHLERVARELGGGNVSQGIRAALQHATKKEEGLNMDARTRAIIEQLVEQFEESHQPEIDAEHGGDDFCSYCETIAAAKWELKNALDN